jgi:hypothetical protein
MNPHRSAFAQTVGVLWMTLLLVGLFGAMGSMLAETAAAQTRSSLAQGVNPVEHDPLERDTSVVVTYDAAPLRRVLADVERRTGVRFLYRDALVAGVRVSLKAEPDALLDTLATAVRRHGLALDVDRAHGQAILTRSDGARPQAVLTGHVIDAASGARLPLATVTWREDGRRQGTATGDAGTFRVPLDGALARRSTLVLTVSYVGYATATVPVDLRDPPPELAIRLAPKETQAPSVNVRSHALHSDLDTTWQELIRPEQAAALGEASVLRALQPLPAVGLTPALAEGLSVRGSRADGFHVLLDGISIYNQHHLFGLFDAFNAEALQAVGFYYGVAPADYPGPPGGTLAFRTRTGAQTGLRAAAEASPTAVSATAEGPLVDGQGSWLVSVRRSILGLGGVGNDALIAQGLGVDRATEPLPPDTRALADLTFEPEPPSARFFDVHAKGLLESNEGGRWTVAAYFGGDAAEQGGRRIQRDENRSLRERLRRDFVDTTAVQTTNRWGNLGASLQWQRPVGDYVFSDATLAASRYYSRYATDDFLYVQPPGAGELFAYDAFRHENDLAELSLTHRIGVQPPATAPLAGTWTLGYAATLYNVAYAERSALRAPFEGTQRGMQAALFGQYDRTVGPAEVRLGLRAHLFTPGRYVRLSPRLQVRLWPDRPVSLGLGYSRNHQFMHRLSLVNDVSSAVWVPSTATQPPGRVDHLTGGLYLRPTATTALQVEGYWKRHANLRQHGTVTRLQQGDAVLFDPWTVRNTSLARGVETLVRQTLGPLEGTVAYTLARVDLRPAGSDTWRPAEWDRRHQVTARVAWQIAAPLSAYATWTGATGPPSPYADVRATEPGRLDAYHRLDLGATLRLTTGPVAWTVRATLFNAYDRDNPWTRTALGTLRPDGTDPNRRPDLGVAFVDVYDLGARPALSVSVRW